MPIAMENGEILRGVVSTSLQRAVGGMKIRRNGTGKYAVRPEGRVSVANGHLCSSAWSCKTGKRSIHIISETWTGGTHQEDGL